jgi:hypothetical protein
MTITTDRAARLADMQAVLLVTERCADLPLPFIGSDRAAYYYTNLPDPEAACGAVSAARDIFAAEFGITFARRNAQHSNGLRAILWAEMEGGLLIELVVKAEHIDGPAAHDGTRKLVAA